MPTYKTEGIIIRRNNFLESSLILDIYTKDYGKVEAVARSARKAKGKLKGHLELFLWTEFILANGKNIDTITSSLTVESFSNLRNNLQLSYGAYYILELVDKMTVEEHQDERIFELLKRALLFLEMNAEISPAPFVKGGEQCPSNLLNCLILLFQINLLNLTGFSPELNKCVLCGKPIKSDKNYFSFSMGGVVGSECVGKDADSISINNNAIKLLRLFQFKGGDGEEYRKYLDKYFEIIKKLKVDHKLVLDSVFLMNGFVEFNIERKVKGVDFLREM